ARRVGAAVGQGAGGGLGPAGAGGAYHESAQGAARSARHPQPRTIRGRHLTMAHATSTDPGATPALAPGGLALSGQSVEGVHRCVHCGLCLASCPTFSELGTEMDSPRARFDVLAPRTQAGRGALHAHSGEHETALALARRTIEAFEAAGVEHVVVNTSGCGAHMKSYGILLAEDPAWRDRARRFAARVVD